MKIEFVKEETIKGYQLKGGEVIYAIDEDDYYLIGKYVGESKSDQFNAINLETGEVFYKYDWQKSLDNGNCRVVESKLLINK